MRQHNMFSRLGVALIVALLISLGQQSFAAGTLAGTVVSNQASVQYNAGSNVRSGQSNTATFTVGYKVSINLSTTSSSTTTVDSTIINKAFYFYNAGNYSDDFKMTVANVPTGWTAQLYKDKNNDQLWDGGDSLITSGGALYTDTTIANRIPLILRITIPRGSQAPDDTTANITVNIESNGTYLGSIVRVGGVGTQTYTASVTIAKPVISFSVTPTYTTNKIPGENQSFALTITNTGHAATVGNSTVTWKYDDPNLENESAVSGSATGGTATWTIGSLAALTGTTTVTFTADIEQTSNNGTGVPAGTTITNGTSGSEVTYNDGLHSWSENVSSTTAFTVGQASGAYVSVISSASQSGNPGDSVVYLIRVKNRGNSAMTFTLSQAQNGGDLDTTHWFTETNGATGTQPLVTSSVAAGDSLDTVYVYLRVNVTGTDGQTIIRNLTATPGIAGATPNGTGNYNPTVTITTTVTAPSLSIVLSQAHVYGVGNISNPAPGDTIEYTLTITNSGAGSATNLTTSNAIPTNTTFGPNSYGVGKGILVDGVAKTNASDADGATFSSNTVTTGPFTVAGSGGTKTIKYRVAVN
ncbi:MAG: hypothetical protein AB1600_07010 [Bacteroidota bacterium]